MNAYQRGQCKSNAGVHFYGFKVQGQICLIKNRSPGKSELLSRSGRNLFCICFIGLAQSDKVVILTKSFTPLLDLVGERIIQNYK